jgi:hypothetical protein
VDRPAGRDGPAAPVVRAAAGDPGAARPDPHPAAAGPRPHPGMAAAGKAPGRRPGQAVVRGLVAGQDQDRPRILEAIAGGERDPKAWPPWPPAASRAAAPPSSGPWTACRSRRSPPRLIRTTWTTSPCSTGPSPRSRTRSRPPWTPSPPPGESAPTASPAPGPGPGAAALPAAERLAEIPGVSLARHGDHRRDRPGHDPVPDRRPPGLLGRARPRRPPVRAPQPQAEARDRATPTSRATAPRPPPAPPAPSTFLGERLRRLSRASAAQGQVRRRPLHPRHHLAPARRPRSPLHRPRPRLARAQGDRDRKIRAHLRQLQALGLDVTITPPA